MILRVYAMWNRSRIILCVLLFLFIAQTITGFIYAGIYINSDTYFSGISSVRLVLSMNLTYLTFSRNCSNSIFTGCLAQILLFLSERPTGHHSISYDSPFHSQRCSVTSRTCSTLEGVTRDVQGNETVAAKPVHEASCKRWYYLFRHVRGPPSLSTTPSSVFHACQCL